MKTLVLWLSFFCAAAATPPEVNALIAAARATAGEFAADAMIRVASIESLERDRRVELLEQAFQRAATAQQPYKRAAALVRMAGPVAAVNKAYAQDLDMLSLRLRAVEGLLPLDAQKARVLFAQIPALKLPRAACEDYLVYDVGRYYEVLEKVVRNTDPAERPGLLERAAEGVSSPVQVGGMAHALAFADVPDETFGSLMETFGKAMTKVTGDDRSFTYARQVGLQIESLTAECKRRKLSPLKMLEGYRVYLVFNLSAARCADNMLQGGGITVLASAETEQISDFVTHFNQKLQMAPLQPIHELESTASRFEGTATGLRDCQDAQCTETAGIYRGLMIGPNETPIPPSQRNTPQWEETLQKALQSLAAWKPNASTTPVELFREKAAAYSNLLNLAPPGPSRTMVLRAMLQFVAQNPLQKTHRIDWFLAVNGLIGRTTLDPVGFRGFSEELGKSPDPVIALFAAIEALAPRPPERILSLL